LFFLKGTWVSIDSSGEDASLISSTHSSDGNYDMLESQSQTPGIFSFFLIFFNIFFLFKKMNSKKTKRNETKIK